VAYTLSIRKEAEADIAEAYQYYESCREGLGAEFISCIDEAISRIQNNPKQFRAILNAVRRALVRRFTYGVYYTIIKNEAIVLAVVHARRNPKHWQSRS
jgi:plasmid stabilization system protein ParE